MKKMMLLATVVRIVALMMAAAPAFAATNNNDTKLDRQDIRLDRQLLNDNNFNEDDFCNFFDCNNFDEDDFCNFFDCNNPCNFFDCNNFDNNAGISQSNEQEVSSGDVSQTFNVTGGGDNSNQIVGIQGVANTGNSVNNTSVIQTGPFFNSNNDSCQDNNNGICDSNEGFFGGFGGGGEVEIANSGNFTISPSQTVSGTQQVNQTAVAFN